MKITMIQKYIIVHLVKTFIADLQFLHLYNHKKYQTIV